MKQRKTTENYLKAIYLLSKTGDVHGTNIAEYLGVTKPTVSVSLKSLESEGYLSLERDKSVHLTSKGRKIAESIYEKNKTLKDFLLSLGVSENTASKCGKLFGTEKDNRQKGIVKRSDKPNGSLKSSLRHNPAESRIYALDAFHAVLQPS